MEINFVEYLISKGYKFQRFLNLKWIECEYTNEFSSMSEGGKMVRLYKKNSVFYYGLEWQGLPPTLLTPIPRSQAEQSAMIDIVSRSSNDEIFNNFFNYSLV